MKSVCPDVRIVSSVSCFIATLAYAYAGSLLFLVFSCFFALLAIYCFAFRRGRFVLQKVLNCFQIYVMMAVTWLLLGIVYLTVFVTFRCVLFGLGKGLYQKTVSDDSSWVSVAGRIKCKEFKRQF
jgi:hypothetical protein